MGIRSRLNDIFRENGQIYNGNDRMVTELFKSAFYANNEETMKGLIFPDSPVMSYKDPFTEDSYLQIIIRQSWTRTSRTHPNIDIVQLLIDSGINIDNQNKEGYTALHLSAMLYTKRTDGQLEITRVLLQNGANQDIKNKAGLTPLELNLFLGKLDVAEEFLNAEDKLPNVTEVEKTKRCQHLVKCLLKTRNNWNIPSTNYSVLLQFLILNNDEETFDCVAKNTIFNVNAVNHQGNRLIHLAAEQGTPRMIRALINLGADPDALCKFFETPLITAIRKSRTEIFHCLIDCGASVNKGERDQLILHDTNSPLQYAVCKQNFEMVERLVQMGADVNAVAYQRSPLLLACGSIFSTKWSRYHDMKLRSVFYIDDRNDYLPRNIHDVPFSVNIVKVLLDHGAEIEAKNPSNRTPLDQACRYGLLDTVKLLLSRGAKIDQGDVSTLHHAVRGENPAVVKLILDQGADVNFRCAPERRSKYCPDDPDYFIPPPRTPLECALVFIEQDLICRDIVEILLAYGVNVNDVNPETSETPLHLACRINNDINHFTVNVLKSRAATLRLLLSHYADVNALDSAGLLPLDYVNHRPVTFWFPSTTRLQPDLETMLLFITKIIATKGCVIKENLVLLADRNIRPFYEEFVEELSLMKKSNICESRNFSFFNILSKDIDCLGNVLKDENIFQVLYSGEYRKNFPNYAQILHERILEASIRKRLVELGVVSFQKYVHRNFSACLVMKIFRYLNLGNLNNLAKACFADVE